MKIQIDGKEYELEELEKQIQEAKYQYAMNKDIKYGDKVWHVDVRRDVLSFSVIVRPHTWTGSDREFQLLKQCLIFRTESSAIYAMNCLYDAMMKF